VVVPSNPYDAKGLLKSSIRDEDPVIFMESELMYGDKGEVPEEEYLIPIGVADVKREGEDVTIVSFGKMMKIGFGAAEELQKENISCRSYRPAHRSPDRFRNGIEIGEKNQPVGSSRRSLAASLHFFRDRLPRATQRFRLFRCAGYPGYLHGCSVALRSYPDRSFFAKCRPYSKAIKEVMYQKA
jgi:hypothetical protein